MFDAKIVVGWNYCLVLCEIRNFLNCIDENIFDIRIVDLQMLIVRHFD
jgi:hypothetical protein